MEKLIERYLKNLMNAEEKSAFIAQLQYDEALQQEVRMAKISIMLEAVLKAELQDEDDANKLIVPIPNENDNGTGKHNDFSPVWMLGIAASFLIMVINFFGGPKSFEQQGYQAGDYKKSDKYLPNLNKSIARINHKTLANIMIGSRTSAQSKLNLIHASSSTCIQRVDSMLVLRPANGGMWNGKGVVSDVRGLFIADCSYACLPDTIRFLFNNSNASTYQWDFGSDFASTFKNEQPRIKSIDSVVWHPINLNSKGWAGFDSTKLEIKITDWQFHGSDKFFIYASKYDIPKIYNYSIHVDTPTLAFNKADIDTINHLNIMKKKYTIDEYLTHLRFLYAKKRIIKQEYACLNFLDLHEPSEKREISRSHKMRELTRKPFLKLRILGKACCKKKCNAPVGKNIHPNQTKK